MGTGTRGVRWCGLLGTTLALGGCGWLGAAIVGVAVGTGGGGGHDAAPPPSPDTTVPSAPGTLSTGTATDTTVVLNWTAASDNVSLPSNLVYRIFWSTSSPVSTAGAPQATTGAGALTWTAGSGTPLAPATQYYFRVVAVDEAGLQGADSNEATATTLADTTNPTWPGGGAALGVTGVTATSVSLSWSAAGDNITPPAALVYDVWWSTASPVSTAGAANGTSAAGATTFTANGLTTFTPYFFRVRARDAAGNRSVDSNETTGTPTNDAVPPTFGGVTGAVAVSPFAITVTWAAGSDGVTPTNQLVYEAYLATTSGGQVFTAAPVDISDPGVTSMTLGALLPSTTYYIVVRCRDLAGNRDANTVEVNAATPAATGPAQGLAGNQNTPRDHYAAGLLPDGRVLVAGGVTTGGTPTAASEVYDPDTGTWSTTTGALGTARFGFPLVVMDNGQAMVAGGQAGAIVYTAAEIYDPATATWTNAGNIGAARVWATGTRLLDGRVLVAGGGASSPLVNADIYDPTTGTWTAAGVMGTARQEHAAALLADGRVLVCGGRDTGSTLTASAEIYDPSTGTWAATGAMAAARQNHTATRVPSGKVIVAGGFNLGGNGLTSCEIYDPATGTWAAYASLTVARGYHTAAFLSHGRLILVGGEGTGGGSGLASTEVLTLRSGTWAAGPTLATARYAHASVVLPTDQLCVTGGLGTTTPLASTELLDFRSPAWRSATALGAGRYRGTATVLPSGRVLLAGGYNGSSAQSTSELYDPATGTWSTTTGALGTARYDHQAVLLADGRVLAAAGYNGSALSSCEVYDPSTGTWTGTGALAVTRNSSFTLSRLRDGHVLLTGGDSASGRQASCELYDPVAETWTMTGAMIGVRVSHSATTLADGRVLVAGGADTTNHLASCEIYDPATGTWSAANPMLANRHSHGSALLPNGRVLVTGGFANAPTGPGYRTACELYDPGTGTWTATGALATANATAFTTLLPDGQVAIVGGETTGPSTLAGHACYDPAQGGWVSHAALGAARHYGGAVLLPGGDLLVAGGDSGAAAMSSVERRNPGLGNPTFTEPRIDAIAGLTAFPVTVRPTDTVTITGVRFRGATEAAGGQHDASASDTPIVTLVGPMSSSQTQMGTQLERRLVLSGTAFASGTTVVVTVPAAYHAVNNPTGIGEGYYTLQVTVNGITSAGRLVRVQADGALDRGFGFNGVVTANLSSSSEQAWGATNDGTNLYIVGNDASTGGGQLHVEKRLLSTGALVTGFNSTGIVTVDPSVGDDRAWSVLHDGTNLYILAQDESPGNTEWRVEKRLMSTGALVSGFNSGGVLTVNPSSSSDVLFNGMHDGTNLYLVGYDYGPGNGELRIEKRSLSSGALDGTFGGATGVVTSNPSSGPDAAYAIVSDGTNLYIAGYDTVPGNLEGRIEKRLASTGALVTGFNSTGVVTANPSGNVDVFNDIAIDSTDLYVVGYDQAPGNPEWRIEKRSLSTGALDGTFGGGTGVITVNAGSGFDEARRVVVSGSDLYIFGYDAGPGANQWRVEKRSKSTGVLIATFGAGGVVTHDPSAFGDEALAVTTTATHLLVVGADQVPGTGNAQWRIEKRTR